MDIFSKSNIQSKNLDSISLNPITGTLTVTFKSGASYEYDGIARTTSLAFIQADNPSEYFHRFIKPSFKGNKLP